MAEREDLRALGHEVLAHLQHGTLPARPRPLYQGSIPGMGHYTTEALWGSVWARPGLDRRLRMLATLSVLSSRQRLAQLRTYLNSALTIGLDPIEIREVLIQCSVYAGFPTAVNSLELLRDVLEARGLEAGPMDVPEVDLGQLEARGRALAGLVGIGSETGAGPASAAQRAADELGLLELRYVWGEIYQRPGLELRDRATCAIAALVALGLEEELEVWLPGGLRAGLSVQEVVEIVMQTAYYAGFPAARLALAVAARVLPPDPAPS